MKKTSYSNSSSHEKIILWASIATLITAFLVAVLFISACSKDNPEQPSADELIGTWVNQSFDEDGEEFVTITMVIKKDGLMTVIYSPDEDGSSYNAEMRWSIKGDKFIYTYVDENEDGVPDTEEESPSEELSYMITGNTLLLSYDEDTDPWEFTKQ